MNEYPDAGKNAQPEVVAAIHRFRTLTEDERAEYPLLYWLLGSGTPPYKMAKADVRYTDASTISNQRCANCRMSYKHVKGAPDDYICSQIDGKIAPPGWCNRWEP
jgi:hypothetical protein